jgi:argonaute-like protein implicated in RNA metabolism and viral defense
LALIIGDGQPEDGEALSFHDRVKRYSLTERVFPTQFVRPEKVRHYLDREVDSRQDAELASEMVNLIFEQIVAKCGGIPHGLASGFASRGTIFIGVDRYRDPFEFEASVSGAASVFDEHGSHLVSASAFFDRDPSDRLWGLEDLLDVAMRRASKTHQIRKIVLLRDGTAQRGDAREQSALENTASRYDAEFIFVEAPKQTHTRLYGGEPDDTGMFAERAPPFTVVTELPGRPNEFIVLATDPWRGTPRPMLYRVARMSANLSLADEKARLARSIAWLCAHSWVSPAATRLPVPLDYADKTARLVGRIRTSLRSEIDRPLFL